MTVLNPGFPRDRRILLLIRWTMVGICVSLTALTGALPVALSACVILGFAAGVGSAEIPGISVRPWKYFMESALAGAAVGAAFPASEPISVYLLVPAFAAGMMSGPAAAFITAGLAGFTLLTTQANQILSPDPHLINMSQWVLLAVGVGLLGAWIRRIREQSTPAPTPERESYASAYRLLSDLRDVSRRLSGGLDLATLAEALLQSTRDVVPFDQGSVVTRAASGVFVPVASVDGGVEDVADGVDDTMRRAWTTGESQRVFIGTAYRAVVPLEFGGRTVALLVLERIHRPFAETEFDALAEDLVDAALRIDTALLFAEVRSLATMEERRRLAREIHDGIAQEVASLGYVIDDLAASSTDLETAAGLQQLRAKLSSLVGELRRSIFDLRSDITSTVSLGTALADYVQSVGADSGLVVHLSLDESRQRLRTDVETELLRIAQEAVTNARKHAQAENLWVTCRVEPPEAYIRVEDDGTGLGQGRADSYGLEIMSERANRIGAVLTVSDRPGGGTVAEVVVGQPVVRRKGGRHASGAARR